MKSSECIAMILAGGRGERLSVLTKNFAKPVVPYGGSYRIIDFTLSNCKHSRITIVGILTQYMAKSLHSYIGNGYAWGLSRPNGNVCMLPPRMCAKQYSGTANAVLQNVSFIENFKPENILILSGDNVYKMDYGKMLSEHKKNDSDVTIAVISAQCEDTSRFDIISADNDGSIYRFDEKTKQAESNLVSMGVYIFKWSKLKKYLMLDNENFQSCKDFGKDIIPLMRRSGEKMHIYEHTGYWRDISTLYSLWESNMDLLQSPPKLDLNDKSWRIFTAVDKCPSLFVNGESNIKQSIIHKYHGIEGKIENSVLSGSVYVQEGAEVTESVIMPNVLIGKNARVHRAIVGPNAFICNGTVVGADIYNSSISSKNIALVAPGTWGGFEDLRQNAAVKCPKTYHLTGIPL